jgi:hypothetical protein
MKKTDKSKNIVQAVILINSLLSTNSIDISKIIHLLRS